MKVTIDSLHMVAVRAVQRDLALSKASHDRFFKELFARYGLDEKKTYFFADDGKVSEVPPIDQVRQEVQELYDMERESSNGH